MSRFLSVLLTLILIGLVAGAATFRYGLHQLEKPGPLPSETLVLIERGSGLRQIATKLDDAGVIPSHWHLLIAAKLQGGAGTIHAGEYAFPARASVYNILQQMTNGEVYQRRVTIPEGLRSAEIVQRLMAIDTLTGPITKIPAEGTLMPDSYAYINGDTRQSMIDQMQTAMTQALESAWQNRASPLPFTSKEQALTLASIIEKETGIAGERAKISGVFVNRLRIDMPLQTDPTVIYAIILRNGAMERPLNRKDIRETNSPYNTYQNKGLPPGPITNPGRKAITAALNPENHDYLYFVANGTGGHAFGKTLAEHNRNVAQWRAFQRAQ